MVVLVRKKGKGEGGWDGPVSASCLRRARARSTALEGVLPPLLLPPVLNRAFAALIRLAMSAAHRGARSHV